MVFISLAFVFCKIVFNNKKHRKDILDNAYNMKNIPVSNKLSKVIIAKDLTIQQRDQNKKSYSFRAMLFWFRGVSPKVH
jgi:hypothetical protein